MKSTAITVDAFVCSSDREGVDDVEEGKKSGGGKGHKAVHIGMCRGSMPHADDPHPGSPVWLLVSPSSNQRDLNLTIRSQTYSRRTRDSS